MSDNINDKDKNINNGEDLVSEEIKTQENADAQDLPSEES